VKQNFERDGYAIVRGVVGAEVRLAVQAELEALVEEAAVAAHGAARAEHAVDDPFETRMLSLFADSLHLAPESFRPELHRPGCFGLFFHPTIVDIVAHIIGSDEIRLYPNYTSRPKVPTRHDDEVLWHQDAGYTVSTDFSGSGGTTAATTGARGLQEGGVSVEEVDAMAASMVNCWTALVPVGRREGCMQFSRGSHHLGLLHHSKPAPGDTWLRIPEEVLASHCSAGSERVVDVVVEPGDIVLFHQYMLHGSELPNLSGRLRWAL